MDHLRWIGQIRTDLGFNTGHNLCTVSSRQSVSSISISSDDSQLAYGLANGNIEIRHTPTAAPQVVLRGHTAEICCVSFSADDEQLVSGSADKSLRVWDVAKGEVLHMFKDHATEWVKSAAFLAGGNQVVSGSLDQLVRICDLETGGVQVLEGHTDAVSMVASSPDGKWIASGSYDGSLRLWDANRQLTAVDGNPSTQYTIHKLSDSKGNQVRTGWLLPPDGKGYLMFVPTDSILPDPRNTTTIPRSAAPSVDFTNAAVGVIWRDCYTPSSQFVSFLSCKS